MTFFTSASSSPQSHGVGASSSFDTLKTVLLFPLPPLSFTPHVHPIPFSVRDKSHQKFCSDCFSVHDDGEPDFVVLVGEGRFRIILDDSENEPDEQLLQFCVENFLNDPPQNKKFFKKSLKKNHARKRHFSG